MRDSNKIKRPTGSINSLMRQLFVGPFYRQHAGTFLFLYVLFIGSFLFINYLGEIPDSESFFWHFVLLILMVTHQFMVMFFLVLMAFYLIKTRLFVRQLIRREDYSFLWQSLGVIAKGRQWRIWLCIQCWLTLPLLIYAGACLLMSFYQGVPVYGIGITLLLLLSIMIGVCLNYRQLIQIPPSKSSASVIYRIPRVNLTKWFVMVYLLTKQVPALVITKAATILFALLMVHWEREAGMLFRQWWLSFLLTGSAHALLVFRAAQFKEERFKDLLGLPVGQLYQFLFSIGRSYILLLLPECLILLSVGQAGLALAALVSEWCILIFFHYFSIYLQFNLKAVLKAGFLLLCVAFLAGLYGGGWLAVVCYLLSAYVFFRARYFCRES